MSRLKRVQQLIIPLLAFTFITCLIFCNQHSTIAQTTEQSALRALVERFFAAYQKGDIESLMALWSKESPDLSASAQAMRRTFAENEKIQVSGLVIREMKVEGNKAVAYVLFNASAIERKTGAGAAGFGKMGRAIHFVKEAGEWKIWRYVSGEEEMADELLVAKTEGERRALVESRVESVNPAMVFEIIKRGAILFNHGELAKALEAADLAMNVASKISDKRGVGDALRLMGAIHTVRGNYTQAAEYFQKSLALAEETGYKRGIALGLNNLGNVYRDLGDNAKAEEYYKRCLIILNEIKQPDLQAVVLNNLGVVYKWQNDTLHALEYYQRSLKLAEEVEDEDSIARALFNIGGVYSAQGNYQQALEFYQRSLVISEKLKRREIPALLGNIGLVHFRQGDYGQALNYYQKGLRMAEESEDKEVVAGSLNNIADVYRDQGDYGKALEYYKRGLALAEATGIKWLIGDAWHDLGETYFRLGDYRKAIDNAERAAALGQQTDMPSLVWMGRTLAGKAYLALNQPDLARRSLLDAISTVELLRKRVAGGEQESERSFENMVEPYYTMVDLSLARNDYFESLDYADRAKSRVLADVLSSGRLDITKAMTVAEQEREKALNNQLVALNRQLYREKTQRQPDASKLADLNALQQKARLEYEAFETSLYAAHPELELQRGQAPRLTPERIGEMLPDGKTALLEFVVNDEKCYLFVLTKRAGLGQRGGVELKTFPLAIKGKELAARVKDFRRRLAERDPEFREQARQLYDLLLKPAAAELRGKSQLCVIPDGVLWELPFQALQPREGSYLIEDYSLFYAPSLAVLYGIEKLLDKRDTARAGYIKAELAPKGRVGVRPARASSAQGRTPTLLAFGNPAIGQQAAARVTSLNRDENLGPLPEAEREVKILREIYKPSNSSVYIGAEARETLAKARMGDYRVLHFATHGVLDDLNPMYSHLVLSLSGEEEGEDGLLHAWEVMKLDLKADMVVLSACQTGRGRLGAGEGVVGMSWALFVAGSPTTVVSQWSVESSSTTQLMVEFHRNLLSTAAPGNLRQSKAEALRSASLSLLKDRRYAHPFYWAGFVMIGDGMRPL